MKKVGILVRQCLVSLLLVNEEVYKTEAVFKELHPQKFFGLLEILRSCQNP